ncbi:MAG: ferrous iron transport protein B [Breznakibacter sp.]
MLLSELQTGESGYIVKVKGHGAFRKRIVEMGFVKGKKVVVVKNAPLKDPIEYNLMDFQVSLRRSEASHIEVSPTIDFMADGPVLSTKAITSGDQQLKTSATAKSKTINVVLVGNPNCGKTTLFNYASGARERTGNYSGVTVDAKTAHLEINGYTIQISDLPGTYSLSAYSPEELFVRQHILDEQPDVVINVLDASNLERNLYLTTQLIDMDIKVVAALNMYDELTERGDQFDYAGMGRMLGIPFVPTISSKGKGIPELFEKVIQVYEEKDPVVRHIHINYGDAIERSVEKIEDELHARCPDWMNDISPRFVALKLLEKDRDFHKILVSHSNHAPVAQLVDERIKKIEHHWGDDSETIITDAKYGFIAGALKETYSESSKERRRTTDIIDSFITHKLFGIPIFIAFMWIMFEATFKLGEYPMGWIEDGVAWLSGMVELFMNEGMLKDLIIDGILGGVGGVIVFLPNILILFFFISFMEDTGYMARAAFIMDKVMHKIGLHGKSFIPLLMGFGCNVPAIMATRTIEDRNGRLLTMLINPFMSCSARLPVYILLLAAFFPEHAGTALFLIYGLGIILAVMVAKIFKRFLIRGNEIPFVMELPPYRLPTLRSTTAHMWHKGRQYLQKMGGIILIASIIIWFLGYFPRQAELPAELKEHISMVEENYREQKTSSPENDQLRLDEEYQRQKQQLDIEVASFEQTNTYIGRLGHWVEPVIKPLGFDWKMGVSLISGVAAKEVVISTMSVLYQASGGDGEDQSGLITKMREDAYADGTKVFSPLVAASFLVFTLVYFPCVAVVAAIRKESGSWKWTLFAIGYTTGLAYLLSLLVFQIGSLFI